MNINLVCIARNSSAQERLPHLFRAAVEDAQAIFGSASDHQWTDGRIAMFNADRMAKTWTVPTWHAEGHDILAVSQPPIPIDVETSSTEYWTTVANIARAGEFGRFLPNHFGVHKRADGSVQVWADYLGAGRCYYAVSNDFVASSNHIGVLTHFLPGDVELDVEAVSRYAHTRWFTLDDSPIRGIRRLREAGCITVTPDGRAIFSEHTDLRDIVGQRSSQPDFDAVIEQSATITRNLDELSVRTPTVYLSGGRDSRMTSALWLSAGNSARVVTRGTLEKEAEVASALMRRFIPSTEAGQEVRHDVTYPTPASITMSLSERFTNAFAMWDGDATPINIRNMVNIPTGAGALNIGGVGGEIMHAYYYSKPGDLDKIANMPHPLVKASTAFSGRLLTEDAQTSMNGFLDSNYERAVRHGCPDVAALDYLYLVEKFRRWGNQALGSKAVIMLSSPAFVRSCFDLSLQQKIDKIYPDEIVKRTIPAWRGVPYYKASPADSHKSMKKKLSTWDTDPGYFYEVLRAPRIWDKFISRETVDRFLGYVDTGEAMPMHEAVLNTALWIDYFDVHIAKLQARAREVRATLPL